MDGMSELSRNIDRQTICHILRRYIGQGKAFSVAEVHARTGTKPKTIYQHLDTIGCVQPNGVALLKYMNLDTRLAADMNALINLGVAPIFSTSPCPIEHLAGTADFARELSMALANPDSKNFIDHQEARVIAPLARQRGAMQFQFANHLEVLH